MSEPNTNNKSKGKMGGLGIAALVIMCVQLLSLIIAAVYMGILLVQIDQNIGTITQGLTPEQKEQFIQFLNIAKIVLIVLASLEGVIAITDIITISVKRYLPTWLGVLTIVTGDILPGIFFILDKNKRNVQEAVAEAKANNE